MLSSGLSSMGPQQNRRGGAQCTSAEAGRRPSGAGGWWVTSIDGGGGWCATSCGGGDVGCSMDDGVSGSVSAALSTTGASSQRAHVRSRNSSSPCANWHFRPYGHSPRRTHFSHSTVL